MEGRAEVGPPFSFCTNLFVIRLTGSQTYIHRVQLAHSQNAAARRRIDVPSLLRREKYPMTSGIRAILGSSLVAAAFAIAPLVASAQTPAAATMTAKPKAAKVSKSMAKAASRAASKAAATTAKADEKSEPKAVKVAEAKVVAAKATEAKAVKAETKAVKAETKAVAAAGMVGCTDGTMSKGGQGACSGHGGMKTTSPAKAVANKMAAAPAASPKAVAHANAKSAVAVTDASNSIAAGATARCKDGTYSHAKNRTGACSGHGGVSAWI